MRLLTFSSKIKIGLARGKYSDGDNKLLGKY
jgi:hypothetical protein